MVFIYFCFLFSILLGVGQAAGLQHSYPCIGTIAQQLSVLQNHSQPQFRTPKPTLFHSSSKYVALIWYATLTPTPIPTPTPTPIQSSPSFTLCFPFLPPVQPTFKVISLPLSSQPVLFLQVPSKMRQRLRFYSFWSNVQAFGPF